MLSPFSHIGLLFLCNSYKKGDIETLDWNRKKAIKMALSWPLPLVPVLNDVCCGTCRSL